MSAPAPASVVHFYSPVTGVSIELPAGFEQVGDDDGSVTYADLPEEDQDSDRWSSRSSGGDSGRWSSRSRSDRVETPLLHIRVVGRIEADASLEERRSAAATVADGFAEQGELVRSRVPGTVDSEPIETLVIRHPEQGLLYVAALAGESRLLTLVGTGSEELDLWDDAVETIRVIEL